MPRKPYQAQYAPVTFSEQGGVRYLHFGTEWVQGAMRLSKPFELELEYAQQMMAWLLFLEAPAHIAQLGLGSAALTKFCWKHFLRSHTTVVELNPTVIAAAHSMFALPYEDARLSIVQGDAFEFVVGRYSQENDTAQSATDNTTGEFSEPLNNEGNFANHAEKARARGFSASNDVLASLGNATASAAPPQFGVMQIDLYDATARGPVCDSLAFYRGVFNCMAHNSVMTINLFGDHESYAINFKRILQVFAGRALLLPAVHAGNVVVLAFKGAPLQVPWKALQLRAVLIEKKYGLPASQWLRGLQTNNSPQGNELLCI